MWDVMRKALKGTQALNPGLKMPHNRPVTFIDADGNTVELSPSEEQHRLLFKLTGCADGLQHYKHCTPHALTAASDLWCPFCMYGEHAWKAAGKALIAAGEVSFMHLLQQQGCSAEWCHQVRHWFWPGCIDFFNWDLGVYVQIDGASHWYGMCWDSQIGVLDRDLRCNLRAFWAGVGFVRVHEADLSSPDTVMAAIHTAANDCAVVFTASYHHIGWAHVSWLVADVLPYCQVRYDTYNNIVVCKADVLTM